MTEIEKMKRYIARTKLDDSRYYLDLIEAIAIAKTAQTNDEAIDAVSLSFKNGQAKFYLAAKAEVRA